MDPMQELSSLKECNSMLKEQNEVLKMDCEQHKKERTMVEARLMEENRRLQEKVDASVNRLGSLEKELDDEREKCKGLRKLMDHYKTESEIRTQQDTQMVELQKTNTALRDAYGKAVSDLNEMQSRISGSQSSPQSNELRKQISVLETQLEEVTKENELLNARRKENEIERNDHRKQIKSMETEKQDLILQQKKLEEEVQKLTVKNEDLEKRLKRAKRTSKDHPGWSRETDEMKGPGWSHDSAIGQDGSLGFIKSRSHEITSIEGIQLRHEMEQLKKDMRTKELRVEGVVNENMYLRQKVYDMNTYATGIQPSLSQGRLQDVTVQLTKLQTMMLELILDKKDNNPGTFNTLPHSSQQHNVDQFQLPIPVQVSSNSGDSDASSTITDVDGRSTTTSISSKYTGVNDYPDLPYDPNLKCTVCHKMFRQNEVQKCKRHNDNCQEKERQRVSRTGLH